MSGIKILSESENTVTLSREDWSGLLTALDDARRPRAVAEPERTFGIDAMRQNYLTPTETRRLLDGENPVKF